MRLYFISCFTADNWRVIPASFPSDKKVWSRLRCHWEIETTQASLCRSLHSHHIEKIKPWASFLPCLCQSMSGLAQGSPFPPLCSPCAWYSFMWIILWALMGNFYTVCIMIPVALVLQRSWPPICVFTFMKSSRSHYGCEASRSPMSWGHRQQTQDSCFHH